MALSILNNISALTAQNSMANTQMSLQKTLTQLSTGMKINSGADDAAGLSIANALQANIAALTQSEQNSSNGIGMLQTADGALSQVTTLLNRAVTLATEGSTSGITVNQAAALNVEFKSIAAEIDQIGTNTNFNGQNVFTSNAPMSFSSTQAALNVAGTDALTTGSTTTISDAATGGTFVFKAGATSKVSDLTAAVAAAVTAGTLSAGTTASSATGKLVIATTTVGDSLAVSSTDAIFGPMIAAPGTGSSNNVFISDGTSTSSTTISTTITALLSSGLGFSGNLSSASTSQTALTAMNAAINTISQQRGVVGASINRLQAANNVMANQVQNLQSASNSIQNADIGKTVANMTQFNILQSTGMAALQQANQSQQAVLKLLQ